jgi:hypothetical protein
MKSNAQRQSAFRERMRSAGFIQRTLWVHPKDWPMIKAYIERKRKQRASDGDKAAP